jgi:hypothetical protein
MSAIDRRAGTTPTPEEFGGRLTAAEQQAVDDALALVLNL